jgi:hypothetical protein
MSGKVLLDSVPLPGWAPIHITRSSGAKADIWNIVVSAELAERFSKVVDFVKLSIEPEDGTPFSIEPVIIIEVKGASMPGLRTIVVADRRILWEFVHVQRGYNVRKRSAVVRGLKETDASQPINLHKGPYPSEKWVLVGDARFQGWSLKNGDKVWTVTEILEDLKKAIDPGWTWDLSALEDREIQLEEFELDDNGAVALQRVLHFLPGYNLRLETDGSITFYSEITDAERPTVSGAPPYVEVGRTIIDVKKAQSRPAYLRVLFTKEVELRFEFDEGLASLTRPDEVTQLVNVMRVPDMVMVHPRTKERLVRASWVEIDDYLTWITGETRPIPAEVYGWPSLELFRRWRSTNFEMPARAYTEGYGYSDAVWAARWDEFLVAWRHLFMISPFGRSRFHSFKPMRASIWSSEHGVRAPAEVYMDWVSFPSDKGSVYLSKGWGGNSSQSTYKEGWNANLADAAIAPYDVEVIDEENGILGIIPRLNPYGMNEQLIPGYPNSEEKSPLASLAMIRALRYFVTLKSGHKMSLVLSVVQAAPNDERKLHVRKVMPSEVEAVIGRKIGECNAPPMDVRIGPAGGWWTAKFAWSDADASAIRGSFLDEGPEQTAIPLNLLCNTDLVDGLALATAAKVYTTMLDRSEGSAIVPWLPDAKLEGRLEHITHSMETDGLSNTLLFCPPYRGVIDAWAWLAPDLRKTLLRQVQV